MNYNEVKKNAPQKKNVDDLPKVDKVVKGATQIKKKPMGKRLMEAFLPANVTNVREYVVKDCLIPAAKAAAVDAVQAGVNMIADGVEMFFFPNGGRKRRRNVIGGKVNYGGMYRGGNNNNNRNDRNRDTRGTHGNEYRGFDYDQVEFDSRSDAEAVLCAIGDLIDDYGFATVGRFYDAAGVSTNNAMTEKYCWTSMVGANVVRSGSSWYIDMPKPSPLD